jgi:class I fructose-bisphosphate aldolase
MNDRIREILSWYANENPGVRTNLARLLNHGRLGGTGKLVILPVDQGFEHGPARSFAPISSWPSRPAATPTRLPWAF